MESKQDKLENRYNNWSTEDLVRATTIEKDDYRQYALQLMKKELIRRNISTLEIEEIQSGIKVTLKEETKKIYGIKGFLLLFILIILGNSLFFIITGLSTFTNYTGLISFLISLPIILIGIYGIFTFILLIRKKTNAPKHAEKWIILAFIFSLIISVFYYYYLRDIPFFLLGSCIFALIWLTYLQNSKRVKTTYR